MSAVVMGLVLLAAVWSPAAGGASAPDTLRQDIEKLIHESGARRVGVAVHDLRGGRELLIGAEQSFHPASTFKVAVMMEVFHEAREGKIKLSDRTPVLNTFHSIVDGSPFSLESADDAEQGLYKLMGQETTLQELVERMITESSNLATNILVDKVTAARVGEYMKKLGAAEVVVRRGVDDTKAYEKGLNNATTARGLMRILDLLAERKVGTPADSDEMLRILRAQKHNEGIPGGLPDRVPAAHKTGWIERLYHDAGIVYPPGRKPYVLVVLTEGLDEQNAAPALVRAISRRVYESLTSR